MTSATMDPGAGLYNRCRNSVAPRWIDLPMEVRSAWAHAERIGTFPPDARAKEPDAEERPEWVTVTDSCRDDGAPQTRRVKRWDGKDPVVDAYSGGEVCRPDPDLVLRGWLWRPATPDEVAAAEKRPAAGIDQPAEASDEARATLDCVRQNVRALADYFALGSVAFQASNRFPFARDCVEGMCAALGEKWPHDQPAAPTVEALLADRDALRRALEHQTRRNHDYAPDACSGCAKARAALDAKGGESRG